MTELSLIFDKAMFSDILNIVAIIVTVSSMIMTIIYANKAKKYKEQVQFDIRKINLTNIVEKLKRTQDSIRDLPKSDEIPRGVKVENIIINLKKDFDFTLNLLDSDGFDSKIRAYISNAQISLNVYEKNYLEKKMNENENEVIKITECIQEAIAKSNTKILVLEKDL